jgi:hypothetical protein
MVQKSHSSKLKRWAIGLGLYLGAVALGLGSAWWVLKKAPWLNTTLQVGSWRSNLLAGSPDADMYTRASVAVNALLALGRDETMYFIAATDEAGRPLRSACTYRIEGVPPKARWWSITAYADDMFLFDAPNKHYSLNGSTAKLDSQGRFGFTTGPSPIDNMYWLPTPGARGMVLTLRLYNPEPTLQASPASLVAPSIKRLGDCA